MPLYEYRCCCGWKGELLTRYEERERQDCPTCGLPLVLRLSVPARNRDGIYSFASGGKR